MPTTTPASGTVRYELDGHVATITYNRPEALNAIDGEMRRGLNAAFARFRDEEDAWVAIVTGAGRAFCAGADMRRRRAARPASSAGTFWEKPTLNSFESGWEIFKPVIAAVNGYCLGYGLTLVTWCDFVIASERGRVRLPRGAASACRRSSARSGSRSASTGSTRWSCCSPASASTRRAPRRSGSRAGSCPTTS